MTSAFPAGLISYYPSTVQLYKYKDVSGTDMSHATCLSGPKPGKEFWREKIGKNISRDEINNAKLLEQGWRVLIWWECNIKNTQEFEIAFEKVTKWLCSDEKYLEVKWNRIFYLILST